MPFNIMHSSVVWMRLMSARKSIIEEIQKVRKNDVYSYDLSCVTVYFK